MKIFSAQQIFDIEERVKNYFHIGDSFLMERVGDALVNCIIKLIKEKEIPNGKILFVVGKGNNGGDGFLCASKLLSLGFDVEVLALHSIEESSFLNKKYRNLFYGHLWGYEDLNRINFFSYKLIIDAILGIGFKIGRNSYQSVIEKINSFPIFVLSIDIPSGLDADTGCFNEDSIIKADITLGLGFPKIGYFLNRGKDFIGKLRMVALPFPKELVDSFDVNYFLLEKNICKYIPKHSLSAHKYEKGAVIGFGGQKGMKGALSLSCLAALHSGAGVVVGVSPYGSGYSLDSLPYEVIKLESSFELEDDCIVNKFLKKSKSIFCGPGLGLHEKFADFIERIINPSGLPVVFDADALNLYAKKAFSLPDKCIFTPHIGEMLKILDIKEKLPLKELLDRTSSFSQKNNVVIVLKSAFTFIFSNKNVFISSNGCLGLATAGSGDILTGIITSFLSQGLDVEKAACLGAFIHGLSGEKASRGIKNCFFKSGDFLSYISDTLYELQE